MSPTFSDLEAKIREEIEREKENVRQVRPDLMENIRTRSDQELALNATTFAQKGYINFAIAALIDDELLRRGVDLATMPPQFACVCGKCGKDEMN